MTEEKRMLDMQTEESMPEMKDVQTEDSLQLQENAGMPEDTGMQQDTAAQDDAAAQEMPAFSKDVLQRALEDMKAQFVHSPMTITPELEELLASELKARDSRDKKRGGQLLTVLAKHNFYANGFTPEELRTTLEDLGPTYVKIGQIMSSRVDLLPENYCQELEKLRQNVKELDPKVVRAMIEAETGHKIDELYLL